MFTTLQCVGMFDLHQLDYCGTEAVAQVAISPFEDRRILTHPVDDVMPAFAVDDRLARHCRPCLAAAEEDRAFVDPQPVSEFDARETAERSLHERPEADQPHPAWRAWLIAKSDSLCRGD